MSATSTINRTLIIHSDGSASYHDVEVFTGTVNGVPGTVTFNLNGSNDAELNAHATATIVSAAGGLAGLHGVLREVQTVVIRTGPVGTYEGLVGRRCCERIRHSRDAARRAPRRAEGTPRG
jgi:Protein of unknown function (DUF3224)